MSTYGSRTPIHVAPNNVSKITNLRRNTTLSLGKNGKFIPIPLFGGYEVSLMADRTARIDATNSLNKRNYDTLARIVDEHGTGGYEVTISVEGFSAVWQMAPVSASAFRNQGIRRY